MFNLKDRIFLLFLAEGMLGSKGGKLDRDALVEIIKNIKRNTKLSDEDAAVIAASKVSIWVTFNLFGRPWRQQWKPCWW